MHMGHFAGHVRKVLLSDMHDGLPTCRNCRRHFTTWSAFRHHVQFVCQAHDTKAEVEHDETEHEHRLRVAEFMQFSNAANFQALPNAPELLAYFQTHCILCGKFHLSHKAMMHHWTLDHAMVFESHGPALETFKSLYKISSPCNLCGQKFRQQHHCVILGQAAMCTTSQHPPARHEMTHNTVLFTCEFCHKAYVTRHGLRDHIVKYHEALTVKAPVELMTDQQLQDRFAQAVFTNDVSMILSDPLILSYLGTTCTLCTKSFKTKRVLNRHLRHHHATLWNDAEDSAIDLNRQHRPFGTCYRDPEPQKTQHTCVIFTQFCMLQCKLRPNPGQHGYAPGLAGDALPLGPGAAATPQQHVAALLFHGQVDQLYSRPALRMTLTIHCMFCSSSFRTGDELRRHSVMAHAEIWRDSEPTFQYLRKLFFTRSGCLCNPGEIPGDDQHQCIALRQVAMIFSDFGMPICVPYAFKAQDLMDLLFPHLTFQGLKEVSTHLMLRQFAKLWQHRELLQLLRSTCLICQEQLQINQIVAHMEVAHEMPLSRYQYHMQQLARIYVGLQSDEWACDFCGTHLQIDEVDFGFAARAFEHLLMCPLLLQMAVLFGHPIWEFAWPTVVSWPDQATLLEQHRIRNLRLWQLNAKISEHPASAYMHLAQCGKMVSG